MAYSFVGIQVLYLATNFPEIYWDCACLISDAGGLEENWEEEEEEEETEIEDTRKTKAKVKSTNYGKIATAIGKMRTAHIIIAAPNINKSEYTFVPDVEHNQILYGLSGITRVGKDIVKSIITNRPYSSIEDFISKIKVNKPQMINLIKAGAFDDLYGGNRVAAMNVYIDLIAEKKKRLTLQNMRLLMEYELIPNDYEFQCKVFNFNKYLKKYKIDNFYGLDETALRFYSKNFDMDLLTSRANENVNFVIKQTDWDKIYKKQIDKVRSYIQKNNEELLEKVNNQLRNEMWEKYCLGSLSKWEMDSISCYMHEHELAQLQNHLYGIINYNKLPKDPVVNYRFKSKSGQEIPLFKIYRIAGTVIDKDKNRKTVTLLTNDGVVTVKIFGEAFTHYDRQISEKDNSGVKHVKEKSWFARGNKIIVTGIRREDNFICKKYKSTPHHLVELITSIDNNGYIETQTERMEA